MEAFVQSQVPDVVDKKYLWFLARKMNEEGFVVFELLKMQPVWCDKIWRYNLVGRTIKGMLGGVVFGLIGGLYINLFGGFALCIFFGLFFGFIRFDTIIRTDDINFWYWYKFKKYWKSHMISGLIIGLIGGIIIGLIIGLIGGIIIDLEKWLKEGFVFGVFLGLLIGFFEGSVRAVSGSAITYAEMLYLPNPYEGLLKPFFQNSIFASSIVITMFLIFIVLSATNALDILLYSFWISSLFIFFIISFFAFLESKLLQHTSLRIALWQEHNFPLRVVTFMDKMSDQRIMEDNRPTEKQKDGSLKKRRGATWRFRHKILQDYFAGLGV